MIDSLSNYLITDFEGTSKRPRVFDRVSAAADWAARTMEALDGEVNPRSNSVASARRKRRGRRLRLRSKR